MTKVSLAQNKIGLPPSTEELVQQLDEAFPNKSPQLHETEKELYFRAGQRSVVEFLIHKQNEDLQGI